MKNETWGLFGVLLVLAVIPAALFVPVPGNSISVPYDRGKVIESGPYHATYISDRTGDKITVPLHAINEIDRLP